jgi:hypothetical protein
MGVPDDWVKKGLELPGRGVGINAVEIKTKGEHFLRYSPSNIVRGITSYRARLVLGGRFNPASPHNQITPIPYGGGVLPKRLSLSPVTLYKYVSVAPVNIAGSDPNRTRVRRFFPPAFFPNVSMAVPTMVSGNPDMPGARANGSALMDGYRRSELNHDFRMYRNYPKRKSEQLHQEDLSHLRLLEWHMSKCVTIPGRKWYCVEAKYDRVRIQHARGFSHQAQRRTINGLPCISVTCQDERVIRSIQVVIARLCFP